LITYSLIIFAKSLKMIMKSYNYFIHISLLSFILFVIAQAASSASADDQKTEDYQAAQDAIAAEWKKICDAGCQPGAHLEDAKYISDTVVPELIALQYKPKCAAAPIHHQYYEEIFECGGRRDLCQDIDDKTSKCRTKVATRMRQTLGQLGDSGLECEREGSWQDDYYDTILQMIQHFYKNICLGGRTTRECYLTVCLNALSILRSVSMDC
jgi:hypothetical protein